MILDSPEKDLGLSTDDEDEGSLPHGGANPGRNAAGKKSNDQRMPSGEATIPAAFPSRSKSCHNAHRVTGETNPQELALKSISLRAASFAAKQSPGNWALA